MLNTQDSRTESSNPVRSPRATPVLLVLVLMGYTISVHVESAVEASKRGNLVAQAQQQEYVVNPAKEVEE